MGGGGGWGQKIKVAQNGLKDILVLEFLKLDEIFKIAQMATNKHPHKQENQPTTIPSNAQTP